MKACQIIIVAAIAFICGGANTLLTGHSSGDEAIHSENAQLSEGGLSFSVEAGKRGQLAQFGSAGVSGPLRQRWKRPKSD